jgi:hypothetical protein
VILHHQSTQQKQKILTTNGAEASQVLRLLEVNNLNGCSEPPTFLLPAAVAALLLLLLLAADRTPLEK